MNQLSSLAGLSPGAQTMHRLAGTIMMVALFVGAFACCADPALAGDQNWTVTWDYAGRKDQFTVTLPAGDFGSVRSSALTGTCLRPPANSKLNIWQGFACRGEGKYVAFGVKAIAKAPGEVNFSYMVDSYGGTTFLFVLVNDGKERDVLYSVEGRAAFKAPVRYRTTVQDAP